MKLNKKLKWTFSLIGLTTLIGVPMSIALVSCNNNDKQATVGPNDDNSSGSNNDSPNDDINQDDNILNYSYQELQENIRNLNVPLFGVDKNNWEKVNNLYNKINSNNFSPTINNENLLDKDIAMKKSQDLLNQLTYSNLLDTLLITFNNEIYDNSILDDSQHNIKNQQIIWNDKQYFDKPISLEYSINEDDYYKTFVDIKDLQYDKSNNKVSFTKVYTYGISGAEVNFHAKSDNLESSFTNKIPYIITTSEKLEFKLIPSIYEIQNKYVPIITWGTNKV